MTNSVLVGVCIIQTYPFSTPPLKPYQELRITESPKASHRQSLWQLSIVMRRGMGRSFVRNKNCGRIICAIKQILIRIRLTSGLQKPRTSSGFNAGSSVTGEKKQDRCRKRPQDKPKKKKFLEDRPKSAIRGNRFARGTAAAAIDSGLAMSITSN